MSISEILQAISAIILAGIVIYQAVRLWKSNDRLKFYAVQISQFDEFDRKNIQAVLRLMKGEFSDWTILMTADRYQWSRKKITYLPRLYFKANGKKNLCFVWIDVIKLIPQDMKYRSVASFCNNQIEKIWMADNTANWVYEIAMRVEEARQGNPFVSENAISGMINQILNSYEIEVSPETNLAAIVRMERKELLQKQLNINTMG